MIQLENAGNSYTQVVLYVPPSTQKASPPSYAAYPQIDASHFYSNPAAYAQAYDASYQLYYAHQNIPGNESIPELVQQQYDYAQYAHYYHQAAASQQQIPVQQKSTPSVSAKPVHYEKQPEKPTDSASAHMVSDSLTKYVSKTLAGAIIGKKGCRINEIRQLSGCVVKIENVEGGDSDQRIITVSGAQESVQLAMFMLKQRVDSESLKTEKKNSTMKMPVLDEQAQNADHLEAPVDVQQGNATVDQLETPALGLKDTPAVERL